MGFVKCLFGKSNGVSPYPVRGMTPHQGYDGRGVYAAGEKRADRHIGNHSQPDRFIQKRFKLLGHNFGILNPPRILPRGARYPIQIPILAY